MQRICLYPTLFPLPQDTTAQSLRAHWLFVHIVVESEVEVSIGVLFHEASVQASVHEVERLPGGGCVFFGSVSDLWHFG